MYGIIIYISMSLKMFAAASDYRRLHIALSRDALHLIHRTHD